MCKVVKWGENREKNKLTLDICFCKKIDDILVLDLPIDLCEYKNTMAFWDINLFYLEEFKVFLNIFDLFIQKLNFNWQLLKMAGPLIELESQKLVIFLLPIIWI